MFASYSRSKRLMKKRSLSKFIIEPQESYQQSSHFPYQEMKNFLFPFNKKKSKKQQHTNRTTITTKYKFQIS